MLLSVIVEDGFATWCDVRRVMRIKLATGMEMVRRRDCDRGEMSLDKSGKQFLQPRNPTMGGTLVDMENDDGYRCWRGWMR